MTIGESCVLDVFVTISSTTTTKMTTLLRLQLFGFICPCHESDAENAARVGASWLRKVQIEWLRTAQKPGTKETFVVSLDATLALIDRPLGPALQVCCVDTDRKNYAFASLGVPEIETGERLLMEIPLHKINCAQLHETEYHAEIRVFGGSGEEEGKGSILLQFQNHSHRGYCCTFGAATEELSEHLNAVVAWNRFRMELSQEDHQHMESMRRLKEEKERLMNEADLS